MTARELPYSALDTISAVLEEIRQVYRQHNFPWVIGYSGGKDSTTALQLVWRALEGLPPAERTKPVYVISSDTLVETPMIVDYITDALALINRAAAEQTMPFSARKLTPTLDDTFWVNLIGRGYPAPNDNFRWCTERLKIRASNRFILEQVAEHGEVILVLGTRRGESATRDQVMNLHRVSGYKLARHGQLPGAWVYMPIEHFTVNDVWTYLSQIPSPWGADNRQLAALYRSAQAGECPLVIDTSTASCGNSRFGCWVCTVVERDRSMEAMIDNGEEWMIPLLEFRDWLAETQDPANKAAQREYRGRDGRIKTNKDGGILYRTYTLDFSRQMLRRLLETEKTIQHYDPGFQLISQDELREIRRLWITERQDWGDSLPALYHAVTGKTLAWEVNDIPTPGQLEAEILETVTTDAGVPLRLVQKLIDVEWQHYGMRRRATIHKALERALGEDWRALDQVLVDAQRALAGEAD
jgi:DNA sulfur modification protein DndC